MGCSWDVWVDQALERLDSLKVLRSLRPISLPVGTMDDAPDTKNFQTFEGLQPWDRSSVEVEIEESTFQKWMDEIPSSGDDSKCNRVDVDEILNSYPRKMRKLLLFSGNDYLGLSSHQTVRRAIIKAAEELGMGPRGSALICGYTNYHRLLETSLAVLKRKEECLLCPSGFAANMALMITIGSLGSLLSAGKKQLMEDEKVAIFSDALNHASIIDGIRLAERQKGVEVFVYRHCDMEHLNALLSACKKKKKVVVTDGYAQNSPAMVVGENSMEDPLPGKAAEVEHNFWRPASRQSRWLFSMDGDFAPMVELVNLRKKHGFLLVVDDAHGTFVCGKSGGGVAELFECEEYVDISVGTLSKAAGCHGGFIACSKKWKQVLQSRGRSFIFSTALPVIIAAAAYAALTVARKEKWRRKALWNRVREFSNLTKIRISSPIISLIVGDEETALQASRHMLKSGFHVTAIRPPTVPPNSCRLRVTLSAAHTSDDIKKLKDALFLCGNLSALNANTTTPMVSRL